ncbi:MAG: IS66 family transposase [Anaerolineae bacterium]|nr:IS66 family transposase [Anaerolineae bacterium]NIN98159.1 IS66 family transposase [Anaerolineae bacterium]NIS76760.1 IS66 family transposase [Deltaproteobacteria bacterium]
MTNRPEFELTPGLWAELPQQAQVLITAMQAHIDGLETRVRELETRLDQNSQNSSRPPSSDPPGFKRPQSPNSSRGRKRGGQPGHRGHHRIEYSESEIDEVVELHPSGCEKCGTRLEGRAQDERQWCHQVVELPEARVKVTEYRLHSSKCPGCGHRVSAELPSGVPSRPFGPRLQATAAMLTGRYRLSRREAQRLLKDLWGVKISLGALSGLEGATSGALESVINDVAGSVKGAAVVNVDETGWRENGSRGWVWTAVTEGVTLFRIDSRRSGDVVVGLVGENFRGVVGSDRYSAYKRIAIGQRALCYAHLKRNFQSLVDRGGEAERVGSWGIREMGRLFTLWHSYRNGEEDWRGLQRGLRPIKARFGKLLEYGKWVEDPKAWGLCWNLSELWEGLWTFCRVEGVEPTNNGAERALRPVVLWRKGSFGSQSSRGSRFAERMLTISASCRQQKRDLLSFLVDACRAALSGTSPPSLVPYYPPSPQGT